ncbi:serine hydrolase [Altererythrobacter aurantiacus]|uniref:Serine hydrolase n=1 Tax=Parapontixanthobacter aurantiacus TaxID=1463599 RepID=A0A844ZA77_9SPHN|nr:serine hydrolase domain-containing protein [Parapontixanthobacter aurantiacus]MXO84424.1 serine hydrolase [Parapontixanthobacter aurantiacus]
MRLLGATLIAAFALAGCATVPSASKAPNASFSPNCERIGSFLDSAVSQGRTVGASAFVWKDGQEACFENAGYASREDGRPFTRDTLVQIFSMTKPVTGVALMQLWEQGRFGLDDPLSWYLPEYEGLKVATGLDDSGNLVLRDPSRPPTVRDMLRHTAGFTYGGSDAPADTVWARLQPLSPDNTLAEFSQKMAQVPLLSDPGTRWNYSAGVDVQARLVEVLSGMAFADYVDTNIFTPLGMDDSGWKRSEADLGRLARIYVVGTSGDLEPMPREEWLEPNFAGKPMTMGGSGIVTTVDDYMRFARMLLNEGELGGVRVLEPATVRLMATDVLDPRITAENRSWLPSKGTGGFGIDFFVRTAPPQAPEENRGTVGEFFWDGYPSMLFWVDPAQDMAVVFATQKVPFDNPLHHDIRDAVYGADYSGIAPN